MRRRLTAALLTLMLMAILLPGAGAAADPPNSIQLSLPGLIVGREGPVTLRSTEAGLALYSAWIDLRSPGGQRIALFLRPLPGNRELTGTLSMPLGGEMGTWRVLDIGVAASRELTRAERDYLGGVTMAVTVVTPTPIDFTVPVLKGISMTPAEVRVGDWALVTANVEDGQNGVRAVSAVLVTNVLVNNDHVRTTVPLANVAGTNRWEGKALVPPGAESLRVERIVAADLLGNTTKDMAVSGPVIKVVPRPVRPEFNASGDLELIHGGPLRFDKWMAQDGLHVVKFLETVDRQFDATKLKVATEIEQLLRVQDSLRAEIVTDPRTGLRVASPNTTGKWAAVVRGLELRASVWAEIGRREGWVSGPQLTAEAAGRALPATQVLNLPLAFPAVEWTPAATTDRFGPAASEILFELATRANLPAGLLTQAHLPDAARPRAGFPAGVVWLLPVRQGHVPHDLNGLEYALPFADPVNVPDLAMQLFRAIGEHFAAAYVGAVMGAGAPAAQTAWADYTSVRRMEPVLAQFRPAGLVRLGDDFAHLFAPADLRPLATPLSGPYPSLRAAPDLAEPVAGYFSRRLVTERPARLVLDPRPEPWALNTGKFLTITGTWKPGAKVVATATAYLGSQLHQTTPGSLSVPVAAPPRAETTASSSEGRFTLRLPAPPKGRFTEITVQGLDAGTTVDVLKYMQFRLSGDAGGTDVPVPQPVTVGGPATPLPVPATGAGLVVKLVVGRDTATMGGVSVALRRAPEIVNSRTFVPVRAVSELLGLKVDWDGVNRVVIVDLGDGGTVNIPLGSNTASVRGQPVELAAPAYVVDGTTMVPLRFISEAMGARVDYDPNTRTITISM